MPKVVIDYSNTIIYKITCKDPTIKDVYVGHTTNFVQRKHAHKNASCNEKTNDCKLYQAIRNNGGWNNWNMEIVNFFNCKDHYEARKKEQEYFEILNATLNSIEPMPKPKFKPEPIAKPIQQPLVKPLPKPVVETDKKSAKRPIKYSCEKCHYNTCNKSDLTKHFLTAKHIQNGILETSTQQISTTKFFCDKCDYKCSNKKDFNKHCKTVKCIENHRDSSMQKIIKNVCNICNRTYSKYSGLWKHKKTCQVLENKPELINELREPDNKKLEITMDLVVELLKQNRELIELVRTLHQENQ